MAELTQEEWRTFLREPVRPASLATVRPDGRAHVAPVWIVPDDDDSLVFTTGADTAKGRPYGGIPGWPSAWTTTSPVLLRARGGHGRGERGPERDAGVGHPDRRPVHGPGRAEAFGPRNAVPRELLVRVTPTRVVARKNISD